MLENALLGLRMGHQAETLNTVFIHHENLAGENLSLVRRFDQIKRARFGGEHDGAVAPPPHDEGAKTEGVTNGHEFVLGDKNEGVRALELLAGVDDAEDEGAVLGGGDEVEDDLGVGGGVEDGARVLEVGPESAVVDEVTVMRDTDGAESVTGDEGLDVFEHGLSGGGVADVADGEAAGELVQLGLVEDVGDEAHAGDGLEDVVVNGYDSGAFLAAVLERVEGEVAEAGGLRVAVDADDAALLARLLVIIPRAVVRGWGRDNIGKGVFGGYEEERFDGGARGRGKY